MATGELTSVVQDILDAVELIADVVERLDPAAQIDFELIERALARARQRLHTLPLEA